MKNKEMFIGVKAQANDEGSVDVTIVFNESDPLNALESAHLLTAGICLLVKACNKSNLGIKDHELMQGVIKHLQEEFVSISSYEDAEVMAVKKVDGEK